MRKLTLLLSFLILFGMQSVFAQTITVTGVVTGSDDGQPITGVQVVEKGTTNGTITDIDGKYQVTVPSDATLSFTFIGKKPVEVAINGQTTINVSMEVETIGMEEVIVVAYGTATKESYTGSAGIVKADELQKRQVSNVTKALAGKVAGVQVTSSNGQPGTSASIRIRGIGSINASSAPLYVVDGVPFDGEISAINPNDIESMTVLKDASANALYGARGANGVILINTQRGKKGDAVVRFDAKWGNNSRAVPKYDVIEDPALYYELYYKALYNGVAYAGGNDVEAHTFADDALFDTGQGGLGYQVFTIPDGERFIGTNFKLNPNATLGYSDGDYYYKPDDWYKELFNKSNLRQEYTLSVSGGSDKFNYFFSSGYLDDTGIVSGSGFKRYTGRSNVEYQAKKWLKVGSSLGYSNYTYKAPAYQTRWGSSGNLFYVSNNIAPIYPLYVRNADGSIKVDQRGITGYDFGNTTNELRAFMAMSNPAIDLKLNDYTLVNDELNSKWFATLTPVKGLSLTANVGVNVFNKRTNDLYNQFYGNSVSSKGELNIEHNRQIAVTQQFMAEYKKSFNVHNFDILVGTESYDLKMQNFEATNKMLYSPWVAELGNAVGPEPYVDSETQTYSVLGYLGRLQYDYDSKYFASVSYRRDGSSRFHPDNRWGNFGSFGLAWLMNKESFMNNISWINTLKLKISYGVQGNDDIGTGYYYYAYEDQYAPSNTDGNFSFGMVYKGNKDITWEKSRTFNVGVEFDVFNSRLTGSVEYFNKATKDLLYFKETPNSAGYPGDEIPTNVGALSNKGIEVNMSGIIFKNDKIVWSANVNATHYKNEVTDLDSQVKEEGIKDARSIIEIGGTVYDIYMKKYAGVDETTGKALYYLDPDNGDYTTTDDWSAAKQARLGGTLPDLYGGFGTQVSAYGFDFSIDFSYQLGGRLYDGSYEELMHNGDDAGHNWHTDILNAWTPENTKTDVPRLDYLDNSYQQSSSRFIVSSDYLSLNSIVLGYTLPKKWLEKLDVASLRLYVSGDNIAVFSKRKGMDPRQYYGGGGSTQTGNFSYSAMRAVSGGVTVTF